LGIDLGTATVIVFDRQRGLLLKEASVIAVNKKTGKTIAVGDDAEKNGGESSKFYRYC
jgi:rod shape-determining protein MreB